MRAIRVEGGRARVADAVEHGAARGIARLRQIDEHLVLRVQPDGGAHEPLEVDPVVHPVHAEDGALVLMAVRCTRVDGPGVSEELHGSLLEDARAVRRGDRLPVAVVDHDAVDADRVQQVGERETGRSRAHDGDGGAELFRWGRQCSS